MTNGDQWLLPDGVDELLPPFARQLELMRRKVLDYFDSCGYLQLSPALVEYIESLLVGPGQYVSLQTFKFTDQLSGRLLGLRADITPQVSRIAAQLINSGRSLQNNKTAKDSSSVSLAPEVHASKECPLRLCYSEPILHAMPSHLMASRTLLQTGAELYGHGGLNSDLEIVQLMLESLSLVVPTGTSLTLGLGHAGILEGILVECHLSSSMRESIIDMLHRKSIPELTELILKLQNDSACASSPQLLEMLIDLIHLHGNEQVLALAREKLAGASEKVLGAISYLQEISEQIKRLYPTITVYFDLSDFRGYNYYTGLVFSAYIETLSEPIAKGGRYGGESSHFDQAITATGYSMNLMQIINSVGAEQFREAKMGVFADTKVPLAVISQFRRDGHRVIQSLTGEHDEPAQLGCSHILSNKNSKWVVESLNG